MRVFLWGIILVVSGACILIATPDRLEAAEALGGAGSQGVSVEPVDVDRLKAQVAALTSELEKTKAELAAARKELLSLQQSAATGTSTQPGAVSGSPAISAAMASHQLAIGMTLDQADKALGCTHVDTATDSAGFRHYEWKVTAVVPVKEKNGGFTPTRVVKADYVAVFADGKLKSFQKKN